MNEKPYKENKAQAKRKIIVDTLMVFFVAISPFIFKLHEYLPSDPEATLSIFGFEIDKNGFQDISIYIWFLLGKIVPLYLLIIWFFTCKHWWYHIILIPTTMYAFQIFEGVFSEDKYIDTDNIFWLLPFCMVLIPFVYLIRIKLYDRYVHGIDLEAMEAELHSLKQKSLKEKKHNIKVNKAELPKVEYRSLSEWLNQELSTEKLGQRFKKLKHSITSMSLFKF
ncbi:hypothetical protein [Maribacter sp. 2308TA10-17]|uniref:hypothetical protein n=1 Tax=Maribacter sp. 2308TA10-17 TaxID=3386276 RepID=UPI0039BC8962